MTHLILLLSPKGALLDMMIKTDPICNIVHLYQLHCKHMWKILILKLLHSNGLITQINDDKPNVSE